MREHLTRPSEEDLKKKPNGRGMKELRSKLKKVAEGHRTEQFRSKQKEMLERFELRKDLQRVAEAYEEADTPDAFYDYMLNTSDFKLSEEGAEKVRDVLAQTLKNEGLDEKDLDKLIGQLPKESEYKKAKNQKTEEADEGEIHRVREKIKKVPAGDESEEMASELRGIEEGRMRGELGESELVGEELKEIEKERVEKEEALKSKKYQGPTNVNVISRQAADADYYDSYEVVTEDEKTPGKMITSEMSPETAGEIDIEEKGKKPMDIGDVLNRPVDVDTFRVGKLKTGWKREEAMKERVKNAPLVRQAKEASTKEFLGNILEKRGKGADNRIREIEAYFAKKYPEEKSVRKLILGEEVKGWFKGKQKMLQKEYKSLYHGQLYQEYLKHSKPKP